MLNFLRGLLKLIIRAVLTLVLLYAFAAIFDLLPKALLFQNLFPQQYNQILAHLETDAGSSSLTAGASKYLYDYFTKPEETAEDTKSTNQNDNTSTTATTDNATEPANPIDKAKDAVNKYQEQIQKEKEALDKI